MKRVFITFFILLVGFIFLFSQPFSDRHIDKQTFAYSVRDNDTLFFDKYDMPEITGNKPCVIFVFGGGFSSGERDSNQNARYMQKLAESGYIAIAIDYRLGMKNVKPDLNSDPMAFVNLLENTIRIAVEDLFDATAYVLQNADAWNIDKNLIIANGSSAGAVTVLQAEYAICTNQEIAGKLPDGFNYAGIIAFAGAIFTTNGDLNWINKPAPIQMFHGDADRNIPYDKLEMFNLGFYGSKHISEKLDQMQANYYFYDVTDAAHEMAGKPMENNLNEINSFIKDFVIEKQNKIVNSKIRLLGKPTMKKDFEIIDYIQSNYQN